MAEQRKKSGKGCLFWGAIIFSILLVVIVVAAYMGYRYARGLVEEYTDTKPMTFPELTLSQAEISQLRKRVQEFGNAVNERRATAPLTLTSEEVNALILTEPGAEEWKGKVYVTLNGTNLQAQVSIPAERIGLKPLRGRYLNASGDLRIELDDGVLYIGAESLSAKGKPIPESLLRHVRAQNFAQNLNRDRESQAALQKLEDIRVENSRLVIDPK